MKKKTLAKRLMAAGLSTLMVLSMAACGQNEQDNTSQTASDEQPEVQTEVESETQQETTVDADSVLEGDPVEISIAIWNADESFVGDEVLSTIEEKLNIKITPVNVTWDDYTQKIQLWASSGSLPDLFVGDFRNTVSYPQWADQGVIKAIPEDLSAYPMLEVYLNSQAAEDAKLNGSLYCIPRQSYPSQEWTSVDRMICYRWDLAQKAGIEKEPETWEEFQEMIDAIIKADPDGTGIGGMTAFDKGLLGGIFMPYASPLVAEGGSGFKWVLDDDGLYKPAYFVENTVAGFQLARDLYDAGVIEKDIALTTNQSAEEKFLQGKSAAVLISGGFGNPYTKIARYWEEVHGTEYLDDVKALKLMPDVNGNLTYPIWGYAWSESYINASVDDVKLDRILRLYDYLLTDEGALYSTYGPEGDLYDLVDGKVTMHDESAVSGDVYPSCNGLSVLVRWNPSTYDDRFISAWPQEYTDINNAVVDQAKTVEIPEYNQRCTQLVMELGSEFTINFNDDFLNIMTGEEMWAELCEEYEADGLSDMITQINDALNE